MPGGNRSGVDRHDEALGRADRRQQRLDLPHLRGEAAIETHHQNRPSHLVGEGRGGGAGRRTNLLDLCQLFPRQAQRLFNKHMLAGAQRLDDIAGMAVVAGRDDDGIHLRIGEDRGGIGGSRREAEFAARVQAAHPPLEATVRSRAPAALKAGISTAAA